MNGTTDEAAVERAHPPPSVSLDVCTASELAKHLLENRFEGDAMATTTFLLECTQTLPDADTISAEITGSTGAEEEEDGAEEEQVEAVAAVSHDSDDGAEEDEDADDAAQDDGEDAADDDDDDDGSILTLPGTAGAASAAVEVSATVPRGKFDLTARSRGGGLTLRSKKDERIAVPSRAVARVVLFPRPEECRRPTSGRAKRGAEGGPTRPGRLVLIVLRTEEGGDEAGKGEDASDAGVMFRGKALKQVCFQLPRSTVPRRQPAAEGADGGDGGGRGGDGRSTDNASLDPDDGGAWASTLSQALDVEPSEIAVVSNPAYSCDDSSSPSTAAADGSAASTTTPPRCEFRSDATASTSTTTSGMPYVSCYRGVHDGALFPLREGLLFFKPPLFVPRSALVSISCGRGGGNSRYVDLVAVLEPEGKSSSKGEEEEGKVLEFTNIAREEVKVLNDYIHGVLVKAMEMDADAAGGDGKGGGGGGGGGGESSSTEEEDDDDDHGDAGSSAKVKAKAKATIRDEDGESDEDEEDDSDYAEGDGSYAEEDDATESDDDDDNNDDDDDDEDEECCIEESPPPPKKKARRG